MQPLSKEQEEQRRRNACNTLRGKGFYSIGGWLFMKDGVAYDLSAADLSKLDYIVENGLFVVEITDLPKQDMDSKNVHP